MGVSTRDQLITEVLAQLGVLAAGQPQAPEDTQRVDVRLDKIVASLNERHITYVPNTDAVPDPLFYDLAVMIADALKGPFELLTLPLGVQPQLAERNLRDMLAGEPSRAVLATDYF